MGPQDDIDLEVEVAAAAKRARQRREQKFGQVEAGLLGAADGATFNLSDEIAGFTSGLFNRKWMGEINSKADLDASLKQSADASQRTTDTVRGWQEKARTDRPLEYFGGNIAGGVATLPVGGAAVKATGAALNTAGKVARVVPGVKTAAKVGGAIAKPIGTVVTKAGNAVKKLPLGAGPLLVAAGKGMGPGAAYAALAAAGEGKDDRLTAAFNATGPGALMGAGFGAAFKGGSAGIGALWNVLGRPADKKAVSTLARLMRKHDVDPAAAAAEVKKRGAGKRPVFETSAEFMGPGAEGMQTALGTVTGPSQKLLQQAFTKSIRNMRQNINKGAKDVTGKDAKEFHQATRDHEQMRLERDAKAYSDVQGHPLGGKRPPLDSFTLKLFNKDPAKPHLQPVAFRPLFGKYVADTLKAAKDNGDWMAKELSRFKQLVDERKMPRRALSVRAINEIDQRIGQDIDVAIAKGRNKDAAQLYELREALRITDFDTGLGAVREQSSIGLTARDAFKEGRKAFQNQVDFEDVALKLGEYPKEVADAYLTGMVRQISDKLANQRNLGGLADAANEIIATPAMRDKLISALPTTKAGKLTADAERFMTLLDRVSSHTNRARMIYGNSATAPRQAAVVEAEAETGHVSGDVMDFIGELITRQPGRVSARLGGAVRDRVTRPGINNPKINEELGKRLSATGKDDILKVLDEIAQWNNRPTPKVSSDAAGGVAARLAGQRAGTSSAENDPWAQDSAMARSDVVVEGLERPMIAEYLRAETTPERRAEIEAMFGADAQRLRALRLQSMN